MTVDRDANWDGVKVNIITTQDLSNDVTNNSVKF